MKIGKNPVMRINPNSCPRLRASSTSSFHGGRSLVGLLLLLVLAPRLCAAWPSWLRDPDVEQLRCEYLQRPLGIDTPHPRLSWVVGSRKRGQKQTAYQILVASGIAQLMADEGDLWDSGKVLSDQTAQIPYAGKPLQSSQRCFWKVRVWDKDQRGSSWSKPAFWEMGLLNPEDWSAQWIGRTTNTDSHPAPYFRRVVRLEEPVRRATVYVCGLGYYELHVNGATLGHRLLDPGYTRYDKRVLYATHDITDFLKRGPNAIGVVLGNGWFNVHTKAVWKFHEAPWRAAPRVRLQLRLQFADGRVEQIGTDERWKTATGPIRFDSIYSGETYDARLELTGWDQPNFQDAGWQPARKVAAPRGRLVAQMMPPIRITRVLNPIGLTEPAPGVFVFDFGQNLAGRARLNVRGPAGAVIVMKYGERLGTNGLVDRRAIAKHLSPTEPPQAFQQDTYILHGRGRETWASRFTYHGFQYVEVHGWPGTPKLKNLQALFNHSDVPPAGQFECSNPLLNRIQEATRWAYLSNLQSIPTDCPHREKNGWTGDAHLAAEQAMYNFFPPAIYTKWIHDLGDEQRDSGELPGIVPTSGWGYDWGNGPAWDSAFLLIPHYLYVYYGDTTLLRQHYPGFRRYVDYLTRKAPDGIVNFGLNDWAPYKTKTGAAITSTAYYYVDTLITAHAAALSGDAAAAQQYTNLAARIRRAFNQKFYQPETGLYDNGSQTALSCALYQKLVAPENQERVLRNLLTAIQRQNGHIDTGILGAKYVLNALLEHDQNETAYRLATQTDQPGWGWWIEQGATTLWEQWNGEASRNHIMFGDISAWFYKAIAGIQPDPAAPGFKHFFVQPHVLGDLRWAKAEYDSIRGKIVSAWEIDRGQFKLQLTVPANTAATVSLPIARAADIREGRKSVQKAGGITVVRSENGRSILEVTSGVYKFRGPLSQAH